MLFETAVTVTAAPATIWSVVADVERWPEWTASTTRVERLDGGPFAVASRVRIKQPRFPPAVWKVTALEPERSFTWVSKAPGLISTGDHVIEPEGDGARVVLRIRQEGALGPIFGRLAARITRRYMEMEARGLKQRAEAAAR